MWGEERLFSSAFFQCGVSSALSNTGDVSGTLLAHCMYKFPCASIRVPRKIDVFLFSYIHCLAKYLKLPFGTVTCIENGISRLTVKDLLIS